jgi:tetratricopeptide (TPR) repeat protein
MSFAQCKSEGTSFYKSGRFNDAVIAFSESLKVASSADDVHLVYSNRSASYQQLKQYDKAADDATSCTQVKPLWAKGYSHLGLSKFNLGQMDEAICAYQKAIEYDSGKKEEYEKAIELCSHAKRNTNGKSSDKVQHSVVALITIIAALATWFFIFLNSSLYLFSFTTNRGFLDAKSSNIALGYMVLMPIKIVRLYGLPRLSQEFVIKILADKQISRCFGAAALFLGSNFIIVIGLIIPELGNFTSTFICALRGVKMTKYAGYLSLFFKDTLIDSTQSPYWKLAQYGAYAEVAALFMSFASLFTSRRNFIQCICYAQVN